MGDPGIWQKTLKQAAVIVALAVVLSVLGERLGPGLMRLVAGIPDPLLAGCDALRATPKQASLAGWAEITLPASDRRTLPSGMKALAARAVETLAGGPEVAANAIPVETAAPDGSLAELTLDAEGVSFRARCRRGGSGEDATLYLICAISLGPPESGQLERLRKQMVSALNTLGRGSRHPEPVYVTVHAVVPELLDERDMEAAAKGVAARLWGRLVDAVAGEAFYSVLMHATVAGPSISVAGQPVNLALVFSPDPASGNTRVVLGTPLCAGDY